MNSATSHLEQKLLEDLSAEKAFEHLEFLVNDVGERIAGTEELAAAAGYIERKMRSFGLEAKIDRFPIFHSYPKGAELKIVSPKTEVITAKPACHIASTLPEGLEGELVHAGVGGYEDYEGLDVRGKIVLTGMTWAPPRPEKARIAHEKGAKALIIMNWGPVDNPVIQMGGVKSQWGNPTPESYQAIPLIPVISITRGAGEYLRELIDRTEVRVWLRAEATREWVSASQPVGFLKAEVETDEFILVGSHMEAWGKTAVCNSSGNSLTLELARVLAAHRRELRRNVVFAFWDGHEVAEAAGSTWFVDSRWESLSQNCLAYLNVDNPGIRGTSIPGLTGVAEMREFLQGLVRRQWDREATWSTAYKGGDSSFFGVGVPYVGFYTRYTEEELKRLNYASLSPTLHSEGDTIDKLDQDLFKRHLDLYGSLVSSLANTPRIPYDFAPVAEGIKETLAQMEKKGGDKAPLSWEGVRGRAREFGRLAEEVQGAGDEDPRILNRILIKWSRTLSPLLRSEAGRYGHDPYGYTLAQNLLPRLHLALTRLNGLEPGTHEFHLWETQLVRERNRLLDALDDSIEFARAGLGRLP